jgi:hypothetical protein
MQQPKPATSVRRVSTPRVPNAFHSFAKADKRYQLPQFVTAVWDCPASFAGTYFPSLIHVLNCVLKDSGQFSTILAMVSAVMRVLAFLAMAD